TRPGQSLHGTRRRSGGDDFETPQGQRTVHHPETARGTRRKNPSLRGGHPRRVLRWHLDATAIRPLYRRGSAGESHRLLSDLRQHPHGTGGERAVDVPGRLLHHLLRPAATGCPPSSGPEPDRTARKLWRVGPRRTDHVDEGVLYASLPRTRRSHPPPPPPALRPGW